MPDSTRAGVPSEIAFWIVALACAFLFPSRYLIMTDTVRLALFALSLDLILGYAGIVSLAMPRSSGSGPIRPGCWRCTASSANPCWRCSSQALLPRWSAFSPAFWSSGEFDLTRLMVTLGIALLLEALAERFSDITGGTDGLQGIEMQPILGLFAFDMFGKVGFFYSLAVPFLLFLLARRIVHSPFGLSLRAIRNNPLRAAAIGIPVNRRLIAVYTLAAFYAGVAGALFAQTNALASLDVFSFERSADLMLVLVIGGTGYLVRWIDRRGAVQDAAGSVFDADAAILAVLDRSRAGGDRVGRSPAPASRGSVGAESGSPAIGRAEGRRRHSGERRAMTAALETMGLEKQFGGLKVTRELSLKVEQGARHALIGPNGAGKTTVINLLTGVLKPNGGRILLEGSDITDLPVHTRVLRGLSRTFQINQLYADLTPLETVGLAVSERLGRGADWWRRMGTRDDINAEIAENLTRFHLLDVMNQPP